MSYQDDIGLLSTLFSNLGFQVSGTPDSVCLSPLYLHFRNNTDGSIRWLWPIRAKRADILRFYNAGSFKARLFSKLITTVFRFGMENIFTNGRVVLYSSEETKKSIQELLGHRYAIFTGTVGKNRKGVIWYEKDGRGLFVKVALDDHTKDIVLRELQCLSQLSTLSFGSLRFPSVVNSGPSQVTLSDIFKPGYQRSTSFSTLHSKVLYELYESGMQACRIDALSQWGSTMQGLRQLEANPDSRLPAGMIRKLATLAGSMSPDRKLAAAMAHGDFTPWNMYISGEELFVYDWELYIPKAPLMWDAFHFVFQSGILIHRQTAASIIRYIRNLMLEPAWLKTGDDGATDLRLNLQLYLLINCVYYLTLYAQQPRWHVQVYWLLSTWNEALSIVTAEKQLYTERQLLCMDIFDWLHEKPYAALKWTAGLPEKLSVMSDIDICIPQKLAGPLSAYLSAHPLVKSVRLGKKSYMNTYSILTTDDEALSLDAIYRFRRKSLEMLDAGSFLQNTIRTGYGVSLPAVPWDFGYTWLFYKLNGAPVPATYRDHFNSLSQNDKKELDEYFISEWQCTGTNHFPATFDHSPAITQAVTNKIKQLPANTNFSGLRNRLNYLIDSAQSLFNSGGITITFSGVDGAGKSTVIDSVREQVEKRLRRKVVVLRHRPSMLPILSAYKYGKATAEQRSASTLPRQGMNRNRFSSLLRFAYYFFDYIVGQFYVQFKYVWRGYVVLYDRYYFDFINDGRRSNIHLPTKFTSWWYRFLLKPDLNFFLYAAPEIILKRKQELDASTITELTEKYRRLFNSLSKRYKNSKYISIHNQQLDTTIKDILEIVKTIDHESGH